MTQRFWVIVMSNGESYQSYGTMLEVVDAYLRDGHSLTSIIAIVRN